MKKFLTTRQKANTYFFSKIVFNIILIIAGALLIGFFLNDMQEKTSFYHQKEDANEALDEVIETMRDNAKSADELTDIFHDGNQDTTEDLAELLSSGLFDELVKESTEERVDVFADVMSRAGVAYLMIIDNTGDILLAPSMEYVTSGDHTVNLVDDGLMTAENLAVLVSGTKDANGNITPVEEANSTGDYYFYSEQVSYAGTVYYLIMGTDVSMLDIQISSLRDISDILSRASVSNNGFMFAVDSETQCFTYYENGNEILTGQETSSVGLSTDIYEDGYAGVEEIDNIEYYCVSRNYKGSTVVCAVAQTDDIVASDKYVIFWSALGYVLIMILCLSYAVIVRNNFVREATETKRKSLFKIGKTRLIFDASILGKVFPLIILGVVVVFCISFYTQTLLEISEAVDDSQLALEDASTRYEESSESRSSIQQYYYNHYESKAELLAYLLEEEPSALNEETDRYYTVYDEEGTRSYLLDDEGNPAAAVAGSETLRRLCEENDFENIYIYDENGRTIATSSDQWYDVLSFDESDPSYQFRAVLDGKIDMYVQTSETKSQTEESETQSADTDTQETDADTQETDTDEQETDAGTQFFSGVDSLLQIANTQETDEDTQETVTSAKTDTSDSQGNETQYLGVAFYYYTSVDENGDTVYRSRYDYENYQASGQDVSGEPTEVITRHRSLLQIELSQDIASKMMASTDLSYIFSSNSLGDGFIVLYDDDADHTLIYSPYASSIGKTAAELKVPDNAFSDSYYYGFMTVNGVSYFQYFTYKDGYFLATAIPKNDMYTSRLTISIITAAVSLVLVLFLSATVMFTTEEEEEMYRMMNDSSSEEADLNAAVFRVVLPSGETNTTIRASARWGNKRIPWKEKGVDQKLILLIEIELSIVFLLLLLTMFTANSVFGSGSVVRYIIGGNWERGLNIFACSASVAMMIFTMLLIAVLRFPIVLITSLLGTRSQTVGHLMLSVIKYGGTMAGLFYCMYLLGLDASSLLASAGILSLVIGLGAQSLIKDIIAGVFIVFEGEFRVGDVVTIGDFRGRVMDIGLRTTKILNELGNTKIFNNSDITGVLNMTKAASLALCTVDIDYGQDMDYVESIFKKEMPKIQEADKRILECPKYMGVNGLGASGVQIQIGVLCHESDLLPVKRIVNRELLRICYQNGIRISYNVMAVTELDPKLSHPDPGEIVSDKTPEN